MQLQNVFLLIASYVFYGWWDPRFLILVFASSLVDYLVAQQVYVTETKWKRKGLMAVSLLANLGVLMYFKYFNFFADTFVEAFATLGVTISPTTVNVVLPVGISFYTFQTLSYTIDVYRGMLKPEKNPINFFAFVSFFPQLVAGPIERAKRLLPQFSTPRKFDYHMQIDGLRQILWGMAKKVVIADSLAPSVEYIFSNHGELGGGILLLGCMMFTFQMYGDFSGYNDIALGTAKLFGFSLMINFRSPYLSETWPEIWRRWHISLSTWFRDYVFIPIARRSKRTKFNTLRNYTIVFVLIGFWHGANWNMIGWGILLSFFQIVYVQLTWVRKYIIPPGNWGKWTHHVIGVAVTFTLQSLTLIMFRSDGVWAAFHYFIRLFRAENWTEIPEKVQGHYHLPLILGLVVVDALNQKEEHPLHLRKVPRWLRWVIYMVLGLLVVNYFGTYEAFLYFQF